MADRIRRVLAVAEQIGECAITSGHLILTERRQEIRELVPRNLKLPDGFGERNEDGMTGSTVVACNQFPFPLIEQPQRERRISDFVTQVVRDAAVRVDVREMLTQALGQEPGDYREILIMSGGQPLAISARLCGRRRHLGNGVFLRKMIPARQRGRRRHWPGFAAGDRCHSECVSRSTSYFISAPE